MRKPYSKRAFTLVELLVVISLILLVSSIIFIGGGGGDGAALSSSARITSGIAKGARGQAILKNSRTRLIIHNDIDESIDKYRRFMGIIYEDPETPDSWIAATQGTYLPEGVYFDPTLSSNNGWLLASEMDIEYPRNVARAEGEGVTPENFYYYEFNSNGTMASGFENAWLVIRAGTLRPDPDGGGEFTVTYEEDQEFLKTALIFRRVGTTTPVTDPGIAQLAD